MSYDNRELINIQVGSAGIGIGNAFWSTICGEHSIDNVGNFDGTDEQLTFVGTYFQERSWGRFIPRNITTDLEYKAVDLTLQSPIGQLFSPDSFICSQDCGSSNLYSRAYNITGQEVIERLLVSIRREVEQCDNCVGFQFIHALGGGTGSGYTSLILNHLYDLIPDEPICTYSIFPSRFISECTEENYNTTLACASLNNFTTLNICYDNYVVGEHAAILSDNISMYPNQAENEVLARSLSGLTAVYRFRGAQMTSPGKIALNVTPFPKLHFVAASLAPYVTPKYLKYKQIRSSCIVNDLLDPSHMSLVSPGSETCKSMGSTLIFRGNLCLPVMERLVSDYHVGHSEEFVNWVPNPFLIAHCYFPEEKTPKSGTALHNTTAVASCMSSLRQCVGEQYKRRAFFHHYVQTGLKEEEFEEALENLDAICEDYEKVKSASVDDAEQKLVENDE